MPAAEWEVDESLVRILLTEQFPDLADRPVEPLAFGWDNVIFRLGDDLVVRLPRRAVAVPLITNEQRWLGGLAERLPLPVPVPVRCGVPSASFPMPWSIVPWFPGELASDVRLSDGVREAQRLAGFLGALHVAAPDDAPVNAVRGGDVRDASPRVAANLELLDLGAERADAVVDRFGRWSDVAPHPGPPLWVHGDLHAANVVVDRGGIAAVIDFGDVTSGDPAVDLAIGWMLFDEAERDVFRRYLTHVDDACWSRGRAWALRFAVTYLANSSDNARIERLGRRLLATMLAA